MRFKDLIQSNTEIVDVYVKKFSVMWEQLCTALDPEQPPAMMKKDRFVAGLKPTLRWKVELKKPRTYDEAEDMAKNKEWKAQRMTQLGMGVPTARPELRRWDVVPAAPREIVPIKETLIVLTAPQATSTVPIKG